MTISFASDTRPRKTYQVRIANGAPAMQDRHFFRWPDIGDDRATPDMVFELDWTEGQVMSPETSLVLRADYFGQSGCVPSKYGNGAICVSARYVLWVNESPEAAGSQLQLDLGVDPELNLAAKFDAQKAAHDLAGELP